MALRSSHARADKGCVVCLVSRRIIQKQGGGTTPAAGPGTAQRNGCLGSGDGTMALQPWKGTSCTRWWLLRPPYPRNITGIQLFLFVIAIYTGCGGGFSKPLAGPYESRYSSSAAGAKPSTPAPTPIALPRWGSPGRAPGPPAAGFRTRRVAADAGGGLQRESRLLRAGSTAARRPSPPGGAALRGRRFARAAGAPENRARSGRRRL